ncbi:MAG: class I SAM-dependent methyltransferase [Pseudomonadota bacterium]
MATNSDGMSSERTDTAHHHWDKLWQVDEGRADWLEPDPDVVAFAKSRFDAGDRRALDLGCGVGRHALAFAAIGFETAAIDASPSGLEELGNTASARRLNIDCRQAEMTALPYDDESFDYVLSFNVIYHGDPTVVQRAIAEIARVLKPGGHYQGTMLSKRNRNFGLGREIAPDTFINEDESDKAHPHFYCDAAGLIGLFGSFELLSLEDRVHKKPDSWHWHLKAERAA